MGTIRFRKGGDGPYEHEGYIGQVFEDGSTPSGRSIGEINQRTVGWRAICICGWQGVTIVRRRTGAVGITLHSAWQEWADLPQLEREWTAHIAPLLAGLHPADPVLARAVTELESLEREIARSGDATRQDVLEMIARRIVRLKISDEVGGRRPVYGPDDIY